MFVRQTVLSTAADWAIVAIKTVPAARLENPAHNLYADDDIEDCQNGKPMGEGHSAVLSNPVSCRVTVRSVTTVTQKVPFFLAKWSASPQSRFKLAS